MPRVEANGIHLYHEVHGSGPPLVLIQGLGANLAMWDPELIAGLAERFTVILFENRGTGRSDAPDHAYSMAMLADDAAALLHAIGVSRAHVIGASMGGMIAQQLALDHAACVDRLVLCCTTAGGADMELPAEDVLLAIANTEGLDPVAMTRRNRRLAFTPAFLAAHEDYLERKLVREVEYPTPLFVLAHQFTAAAQFDVAARLPSLRHRTLVMAGREDRMIPAGNSFALARCIPAADLIIYSGAGHGFMTERREYVVRDVAAFLLHP